jgi:hypothetical protein
MVACDHRPVLTEAATQEMKILVVLFVIALASSLIALQAANGGSEIAAEILRYSGPLAFFLGLSLFAWRIVAHLLARGRKNI